MGAKILFGAAAAYDGVLGMAFLIGGARIYAALGITPPNHWGYVHFAAALLLVFAWMFVRIALDPRGRRELIVYGILLKVAYVGVVFGHALATGVPAVFVLFAWIDLAMLCAFLVAMMKLRGAMRS